MLAANGKDFTWIRSLAVCIVLWVLVAELLGTDGVVSTCAAQPSPGTALESDAAAETAQGVEANAIDGKQATPLFLVLPVTTDLQRRWLSADESLRAFVLIDGTALIESGQFERAVDANGLVKALLPVRQAAAARVNFNLLFSTTVKDDFITRCETTFGQIAKDAGYRKSGVMHTHGGPFNWDKKLALANEPVTDATPNESGAGDALIMAYPVRTAATRLIVNCDDLDCVVFFKRPLNPVDRPLISILTRQRLKEAVAKFELPAKNAIQFDVDLAGLWQRPQEERQVVQERLYDGQRTGEMEQLAEELGFTRASVRFH